MHISFLWEEGSTHQSYQLSTLGCYKIHSSVVLDHFRMNLILSITFFFQWSNVLCKVRTQWRDFTSMVALCNLSDWPDVGLCYNIGKVKRMIILTLHTKTDTQTTRSPLFFYSSPSPCRHPRICSSSAVTVFAMIAHSDYVGIFSSPY